MIDKATMRRLMREALADVPDRTLRSVALWAELAGLEAYRGASVVMAFDAIPAEPDTDGLHARIARDGKHLILPRVGPDGIEPVASSADHQVGSFGIREPLGAAVDRSSIDLVVVPGLAFTADGWRLGRGKAYYDRFLATVRAATVGVCFTEQLVEQLPVDAHDVRLDQVLSC